MILMDEIIFDPIYERRPKERYYQFSALYEPYPETYMNPLVERICRRDQGGAGTCVGQSAAYAMDLNYVTLTGESYDTRVTPGEKYDELSEKSFSASCAYHWSREEGKVTFDQGSFIWAVLQALKNRGICLDEQWRCSKKAGEQFVEPYPGDKVACVETAGEHKIDGYVALNGPKEVKAAIAKYGFCVGGIDVWSNWRDEGIEQTGQFPEPKGNPIGGHALVWIGYDADKLYCLHSWKSVPYVGSISWRYFGLCASEFFAIVDAKETAIVKRKYSRIEFVSDVPATLFIKDTNHGSMPVVLQLENVKTYTAVANSDKGTQSIEFVADKDKTIRFKFIPSPKPRDIINRFRRYFHRDTRYSNISTLGVLGSVTDDLTSLIHEFCSDPDEWHALWYGWFSAGEEGVEKFTLDRIPEYLPEEVKAAIRKEYHYYNLGWYARKFVQSKGGIVVMASTFIAFVMKLFGVW